MAHDLDLTPEQLRDEPLILIVPGLDNSNPDHWQSRWEAKRETAAGSTSAGGTIRTATPG